MNSFIRESWFPVGTVISFILLQAEGAIAWGVEAAAVVAGGYIGAHAFAAGQSWLFGVENPLARKYDD